MTNIFNYIYPTGKDDTILVLVLGRTFVPRQISCQSPQCKARFEGLLHHRILSPVEINSPQNATLAPPRCLVNFWLMRGGILGLCWFLVGFKMTPFSFQIDRSTTRTFIRYFLSQTMTARPQAKLLLDSTADWKNKKKSKKLFSLSLVSLKSQFQCVYILYINKPVFGHGCLCVHSSVGVCPQCVYISHSLRKWKKHFLSARK